MRALHVLLQMVKAVASDDRLVEVGDRRDLRLERSLVFGVLIERRHRLQPNGGLVVVGSSQRLLQSLRRAAEGIEVEVRLESEALRAYFDSTGVTGSQNRALEKKQAAC